MEFNGCVAETNFEGTRLCLNININEMDRDSTLPVVQPPIVDCPYQYALLILEKMLEERDSRF